MMARQWSRTALALLGRHATVLLFAGVFLGIAFPSFAALLQPLFVPSVVGLLALSLMRLDARDVIAITKRPLLLLLVFAWLLVLAPIVMAGLTQWSDLPESLQTALVLSAACPPIMSSIAFALMFRLDAPLVTVLVFPAILLVPLTLPTLSLTLLGLELQLSLVEFMLRLAAIIVGSILIAVIARAIVPKAKFDAAALPLDGVAVILLLIFAIAIMDGVGPRLMSHSGLVALTLGLAFAANLGMQAVGTGMFWLAGRRAALSIGLASGNRNMGIILAAFAGTGHPDVALFFALGQVPIYVLPLVMKPIYNFFSPSPPSAA